jgi:uncharacterized membrane protein YfcA
MIRIVYFIPEIDILMLHSGILYYNTRISLFISYKFSYLKAAEMTRFVMFASCMSAFLFYLFYGIVDWGIAILVKVGSIVGSHIGLKFASY